MKNILLLLLLLVPLFSFAADKTEYNDVIKQAELVQSEAIKLTQSLKQMEMEENGAMVSASSLTSFTDLIINIDSTIAKLGELIDSAKKLVETTEQQVVSTGETVQQSMAELTTTMKVELVKLNTQITALIGSVNETVQSTNVTIQNVNKATEKTARFIQAFGGRVGSSYYLGEDGLDSSADLVLWKKTTRNEAPQHSYLRITVDGVDNPDNREYSITVGTDRGPFSLGAGYIQDGFGLDLGWNAFGTNGFDMRTSAYRMREIGLNAEIGYRPSFLQGTRLFVFGEDVLQSDKHSGGVGLSYEREF